MHVTAGQNWNGSILFATQPVSFSAEGCYLNSEIRTDIDERKLRRKYRMRVGIFVLSVGLALVVLSTGYDAIRTLSNLETVEREQWPRPGDVIQELNLKDGNVVVDLGSGVGYFALKLAPSVGRSGKVLAVDVQKFPLRILRIRAVLSVEHNAVRPENRQKIVDRQAAIPSS